MKWALICLIRNKRIDLFENSQHIVGRCKRCLIKCSSLFVSKFHCVIITKGDRIYVMDVKSSNGTYINGHAIDPIQPYQLRENDIIGIGVRGSFDSRHAVFRLVKVEDPQPEASEQPNQYTAEMQLDREEGGFDEEAMSAVFALSMNLN